MTKIKKQKESYSTMQRFWSRLRRVRLLLALAVALLLTPAGDLQKTEGQTGAQCTVAYRVVDQWSSMPGSGGFKAEVTINNTGPAINGWNVSWAFANGQTIYQSWESSLTQTGANVAVTNVSYNATIATNASRTFGFLANWAGTNAVPTTFGGTCSGSVNNVPPTVSITSPLNGASFTTGANIPIAANASDTAPGTVTSVQFFDGITSLGTDMTSPYTATLSNAAAGNHSLTAVATDNQGAVTTSAAVNISVANNPPPTVSITSPLNARVSPPEPTSQSRQTRATLLQAR